MRPATLAGYRYKFHVRNGHAMAIEEFRVSGYRSLRDLTLPLSELTVITGPNGCGKSNLYRALVILAAAAGGALARTLAEEGGVASVLWAGEPRRGPVRLSLGVTSDDWDYEIACGLPPRSLSAFSPDPEVKDEHVKSLAGGGRAVVLLERKNQSVWLRDQDGRRVSYPLALSQSESALSQIIDPLLYPELAYLRGQSAQWPFYHHFRTDPHSPLRQPQVGVRTPLLSAGARIWPRPCRPSRRSATTALWRRRSTRPFPAPRCASSRSGAASRSGSSYPASSGRSRRASCPTAPCAISACWPCC